MASLTGPARQHVEQYGRALVRNTWLTIAVVAMSVALTAACGAVVYLVMRGDHMKPILVERDTLGRPHALTYDDAVYRTTDQDIRVYLQKFFELRYQMFRRTIARDQANVLWFLAEPLRNSERVYLTNGATVRAFLADPMRDEVEVNVRQVTLDDQTTGERAALVDYDLIYLDHQQKEHTRERYTSRVQFHLGDVPDEALTTNLVGIQITKYAPVRALAN